MSKQHIKRSVILHATTDKDDMNKTIKAYLKDKHTEILLLDNDNICNEYYKENRITLIQGAGEYGVEIAKELSKGIVIVEG